MNYQIKVVSPKKEIFLRQCLQIAKENHVSRGGKIAYADAPKNACEYLICACHGDVVIGYLGVNLNIRREIIIVQSAVREEFRGQGIGSCLMNYLKHHSLDGNVIISFVDKDNFASRKIHLKNGFQEIEEDYDFAYFLNTSEVENNKILEYDEEQDFEQEQF